MKLLFKKNIIIRSLSESSNDLVQVKAKYLGKNGIVSELTKNMRDLEPEERAKKIIS